MTIRAMWLISASFIAVLSCGCSPKPPEPEDAVRQNLHRFRMDGALFSTDEKRILIDGDVGGVPNVFVFDMETGGSVPVTKAKTPAYAISFALGNEKIVYRARPQNESVEHLFERGPDGKETDLTPWNGVEAQFYSWAEDRRSFYFGSNKDDRRFMYVYRMDITNKSYTTVLQTQDMRFAASSRDGLRVALWKYTSPSKSEVYLYDFQTKSLDKLPQEGNAPVSVPQVFDAGEDVLYYLANGGSRALSLAKYDFRKKVSSSVSTLPEPIVFARQSSNRRYLVLGVKQGERVVSKLLDTKADPWSEVPLQQPLLILDISPSGRYLLYTSSGDSGVKDLHLYDLTTKQVRRILPT
jgi:Tol biopolymer transport system component